MHGRILASSGPARNGNETRWRGTENGGAPITLGESRGRKKEKNSLERRENRDEAMTPPARLCALPQNLPLLVFFLPFASRLNRRKCEMYKNWCPRGTLDALAVPRSRPFRFRSFLARSSLRSLSREERIAWMSAGEEAVSRRSGLSRPLPLALISLAGPTLLLPYLPSTSRTCRKKGEGTISFSRARFILRGRQTQQQIFMDGPAWWPEQ